MDYSVEVCKGSAENVTIQDIPLPAQGYVAKCSKLDGTSDATYQSGMFNLPSNNNTSPPHHETNLSWTWVIIVFLEHLNL